MVLSQNDDRLLAFTNRGRATGRRSLAIRLRGKRGNPDAIGARVTAVISDGTKRTLETYAGSGYLSQSAPVLFFGLGADAELKEVRVRWPGGAVSTHTPEKGLRHIVIEQP